MKRILVLNGPNLGRLGTRQPEIYGTATLPDVERMLRAKGDELGVSVECRQTDDEGELVRWVRDADADAIIVNPASLTHHSTQLAEAVRGCTAPVYEVHISNIEAREPYRRRSMITAAARGKVMGFGVRGYVLALEAAAEEAKR